MKQFHNTLEAIHANLEEIIEIVQRLGTNEKNYQIDIDLSLDKMRMVYDLMLALRKEDNLDSVTKEKEVKIKVETKVAQEEETISKEKPLIEEKEEIVFEINTVEEDSPVEEIKTIEEKKPAQEIKKEEPVVQKPKVEEHKTEDRKYSEKATLSDKFKSDKSSLNDELSKQWTVGDLSSKLTSKPIKDLTTGIGLNEKFEFINNLFKRDKQLYDATMEKLNLASNFNDAYNYLSNNFNWNMQDEHVQKLLELIRRKLITD